MARKAFIWGSNGPKAIGELKYALDDAQRIAKILAGERYDFTVTSPTAPDDPYQIKKELDLLAKSCGEKDSFVIFFSGHGELLKGELMLVLDRTTPGDETTYLPVAWVKEARSRSVARNRLIVLDCCHAGGAIGAKSRVDLAEIGLESKTELMLLASQRLEIAREFEHLKGSFLTTEMSNFLGTAPAMIVGLQQLMVHLNESAQLHNSRADDAVPKVPIPFLNGDQQGEFYFTQPPSPWIRHQIDGPNGTELLVIPACSGNRVWCIGRTPVTNQQYRRFVENSSAAAPTGEIYYRIGGRRDWITPEEGFGGWVGPDTPGEDFEGWVGPFKPWDHKEFSAPDQPVVCISFAEAETYARWLTFTSWQGLDFCVTPLNVWDIAAFGKDFPVHDRREWQKQEIHDKADAPAPVSDADNRTSLYGAVDMLGNVWEWCLSETPDREMGVITISIIEAPLRSRAVEIRGGSYLDDLSCTPPFCPVSSIRDHENCRHSDLGFRVAATVPIETLPPEIAERVRRGFNLTVSDPDWRLRRLRYG